jgi:hypothetical protein
MSLHAHNLVQLLSYCDNSASSWSMYDACVQMDDFTNEGVVLPAMAVPGQLLQFEKPIASVFQRGQPAGQIRPCCIPMHHIQIAYM